MTASPGHAPGLFSCRDMPPVHYHLTHACALCPGPPSIAPQTRPHGLIGTVSRPFRCPFWQLWAALRLYLDNAATLLRTAPQKPSECPSRPQTALSQLASHVHAALASAYCVDFVETQNIIALRYRPLDLHVSEMPPVRHHIRPPRAKSFSAFPEIPHKRGALHPRARANAHPRPSRKTFTTRRDPT